MKNIFKNAYFDKPYKTRDGRKAIYLVDDICWIEGEDSETSYSRDGRFCFPEIYGNDIVSEWHEEINEEELDELAEKEFPYFPNETNLDKEYNKIIHDLRIAYKAGIKTGYRKAMEENNITLNKKQ